MKNFLIPFDFTEVSQNALEYAVKLSDNDPAGNMYLLHIADGSRNEEEIENGFYEVKNRFNKPGDPEIHTLIRKAELTPAVLQLQKELEIDLVIMGTGGAQNFSNDISTGTSEFIQQADLPVLVIPETVKDFRLNTIVLTVGKDKIADKSPLYVLLEVSRKFKAEVHMLTVQRERKGELGYSEEDESNENTIQYFLEMFYSHHSFAENEDLEKGIMEYCKKHEADMLAILPKTHLKTGKNSEGKLTRSLSLHTKIPLLILD